MRHLTAPDGVEVIGANMLSIIDNLQAEELQPILEKHDLTKVDPQAWYPVKKWLDAMNDMAKEPNLTNNYVAVGMRIAQNVVLPPELQNATLPQILNMWDAIYQMQHRGGDVGYVKIEQLSDTSYRTTHRHLYPDDITYGVAYGFGTRFLPQETNFSVAYEDDNARLDSGDAQETVILVKW